MPAAGQGVIQSANRYHLVPRVLCFVTSGDDVLLLKGGPSKKIWPGKYNGLGGHVERGESVHAAAEREIREEAGLSVTALRLRGVITVETGQSAGIGLFIFTGAAQTRDCAPSAEGTLEWVPLRRVAELDSVEDLPILLPHLAAMPPDAPPFSAHYHYDAKDRLVVEFFGE